MDFAERAFAFDCGAEEEEGAGVSSHSPNPLSHSLDDAVLVAPACHKPNQDGCSTPKKTRACKRIGEGVTSIRGLVDEAEVVVVLCAVLM